MSTRAEWKGTATQLLGALGRVAGSTVSRSKHWPGASHVLSGRLRRTATFLRQIGIVVDLGGREGHSSDKVIRITNENATAAEPGLNFAADDNSDEEISLAEQRSGSFFRTTSLDGSLASAGAPSLLPTRMLPM